MIVVLLVMNAYTVEIEIFISECIHVFIWDKVKTSIYKDGSSFCDIKPDEENTKIYVTREPKNIELYQSFKQLHTGFEFHTSDNCLSFLR